MTSADFKNTEKIYRKYVKAPISKPASNKTVNHIYLVDLHQNRRKRSVSHLPGPSLEVAPQIV